MIVHIGPIFIIILRLFRITTLPSLSSLEKINLKKILQNILSEVLITKAERFLDLYSKHNDK